jgi:hypothetical protein
VKPQDVVIIVFLYSKQVGAGSDSPDWTFESLAGDLKLSKSAIHRSIENLKSGELMLNRRINGRRLIEFLISGVPVLFPGQIGRETYGVETTVASPIFGKKIVSNKPIIWPSDKGSVKGDALEPLHVIAVNVALLSDLSYKILAAIDSLRVGKPRERKIARSYLDALAGGQ